MIDLKLSKNEAQGLTEDECVLAKARKLEILILPYIRRNIDFFYAGGNIGKKAEAYNKPIDKNSFEKNIHGKGKPISTVCKPLCEMVAEVLQENGINAETVSCDADIFKHTDVLITTPSGKKYIINYLEEIENIQTGMNTPEFASEGYYKRRYQKFGDGFTTDNKSLKGLAYIDKERLNLIDRNLGYKKLGMYMNDVIEQIKKEFGDFRNIMAENEFLTEKKRNENMTKQCIQEKWNNMSNDEILEKKLDWIFEFFNDRMDIKGYTDFVMYYSRLLLPQILTEEEYKQLTRYNCFLYEKDIPEQSRIKSILDFENEESKEKVRFCLIQTEDKYYAFSTKSNIYEKLSEEEVKELANYSKIKKTKKLPALFFQLCDKGTAGPILFHPLGSTMLEERESLIPKELTNEQRTEAIRKIAEAIKTTDGEITSMTIPYPRGEEKYIYIDKNNEFAVHSKLKNITTIYHYDDINDEFTEEKIINNDER